MPAFYVLLTPWSVLPSLPIFHHGIIQFHTFKDFPLPQTLPYFHCTFFSGKSNTTISLLLNNLNPPDPMPNPPLKAITLTHVRYTRGDQLGHFLAWVSLVPVFISLGGFLSHFFFRRELQGICFALGLLISQFINEVIKTSVQQARPETCALLEACDSHGWPSSHAQYMLFFAVYFTLLSYHKVGFFGGSENSGVVEIIVWVLAVLTMFSRVYLGYHTVAQVCAGAILGLVLGAGWYWVVNRVLIDYFPLIEDSSIGRRFYIKDTSHITNVLKFEYDNARSARKNAADKSN